jgi:hypothetical protein
MNCASIYIHAFYFTIVTMISVGYGDISPKNNSERIFSVFSMLTSCAVFGKKKKTIKLKKMFCIKKNFFFFK